MLNIQGLMKQAQMMQRKMQEAQEKLAGTEITGTSGNGLVSVVLNRKSEMKKMSTKSDKPEKWLKPNDLLFKIWENSNMKITKSPTLSVGPWVA